MTDDLPQYDLQFVDIQRSYLDCLNWPVYSIRIAMHNLGQQWEDEWSENHAVLYFLLGMGRCVRVDMRPTLEGGLGRIHLSGHNFTQSNSFFPNQFIDLAFKHCPTSFNPDGRNAAPEGILSVGQCVTPLLSDRLYRYRFIQVAGSKVGCRYWV
jgi:hypothetical protein